MPLEFVGHGISIPVAGWDDLVLGRFHPWIVIPVGRLILEPHAEAGADIAPTERAADREGEAAFDRMAAARRPTSPSSAEPPVNAKTGAPLSPLSDGHSLRLCDPTLRRWGDVTHLSN